MVAVLGLDIVSQIDAGADKSLQPAFVDFTNTGGTNTAPIEQAADYLLIDLPLV